MFDKEITIEEAAEAYTEFSDYDFTKPHIRFDEHRNGRVPKKKKEEQEKEEWICKISFPLKIIYRSEDKVTLSLSRCIVSVDSTSPSPVSTIHHASDEAGLIAQ